MQRLWGIVVFPCTTRDSSEWIGVPQSAGLVEFSGSQWIDKLSRDQAVMAAVHLQRDVGIMQTNVDVLDQYASSLQKAASRMIDNCLEPCMYPAEEVAAGALGPRIRRAAVQMEGMGLWRPSLDPLRLHYIYIYFVLEIVYNIKSWCKIAYVKCSQKEMSIHLESRVACGCI